MRAATPRARRASRRPAATALAAVVLLAGVQFTMAPGARADETPSTPPGTESTSPPPQVDGNAPGLKLRAGATLAPAKVLDIISVVESEGGEERREDTNENVKFALQAEVLFGKDSARLSSAANSRIAAIADEIKKQGATKVRVFGFTDDLGSAAHGDVLSKQRAEAVHGVLQGQLTSAGITFEIRGYGEQYPIADNSTEEGRKKNRRVEVSFPRGESS
ncbi:OmpA family protein [Streptomyces scopuliridis]|uniref:OmpA family protein n=1 Tax=Streptomyces scopuliridis TaxID=452529 RepID=UPI002DDBD554|nr:OmpA family protein [Streptomyces scopuliridis]WSB33709.1 OmpA family protein [Streptomyces scopuliridis]